VIAGIIEPVAIPDFAFVLQNHTAMRRGRNVFTGQPGCGCARHSLAANILESVAQANCGRVAGQLRNANCATGQAGLDAFYKVCAAVAERRLRRARGPSLSTGIIGVPLPERS